MSAYNYVERRMAPLSKALAGVVLDHDACGTHLDDSGRTIDAELEKENFRVAGKVLTDIWSELKLDERPVITEYGENERCYLDDIDELWVSQHCRISQHMLQIVKCNDSDCCGEMRSVQKDMFPKRFLPAPVKMGLTPAGPQVPLPNDEEAWDTFPNLSMRVLLDKIVGVPSMPRDRYCPSVQKNLERLLCPQCGIYYSSIAALKRHQRGAACAYDRKDDECDSGSETEVIEEEARANEHTALIFNIFKLFRNPAFIELDGNNDDED